MIPHEYIEELTRRTDIVELVGSYVQLKRKGRLYGGLCPFHSEKTPSFYVYPDTQSFYCFGCQAAGDAISFVKKINNISSGEAIKMLASRAGMPEPQEDDKTGRLRSRVLSMNKEAARFFHACLKTQTYYPICMKRCHRQREFQHTWPKMNFIRYIRTRM